MIFVNFVNGRSRVRDTSQFYDPQPLHDFRKPLAAHAELGGGGAPAPTGAGKGRADEAALELDTRLLEPARLVHRGCGDVPGQEGRWHAPAPRGMDGQRRDDVLQLADGRSFDELSLAEWREHSPLFADDVRQAITALASVGKKRTPQSTGPKAVAAALSETREWLRAYTRGPS